MTHLIEIHDDNTTNTGWYKIWVKHEGTNLVRRCSEAFTNSLLNMRQKEDFFMGKYKFKIADYDFNEIINSDPGTILKYKHEL